MSELIERARRGDREAFERLYRENVGRVFALCLRLAGDDMRAEELTQDVFVKAWSGLGSFRGDAAFSSWLHRIAVNVANQGFRSEKRRRERVAAVESVDDHSTPAWSYAGASIDLERAVRSLPPGARAAFVLHDVEGYTHREIAELIGNAEGTVKAQLHRARRLLRKVLEA